MQLKCCTQYFSKFGKASSSHRTGKSQSSSHFPKRKLKNVQTTRQLHSSPMLVRFCLKSFKLDFIIMWTEDFQMFKLDLEKAEEPEIKLPTCSGLQRKQRNPRKNIYLCFFVYTKAFDCVDHNKLWQTLKEMGIPCHLTWTTIATILFGFLAVALLGFPMPG